jgi:PKD repeat protein
VFRYDRATGVLSGSYKPVGTYKTVWDVALTPNGNLLYKADPTYSSSNYQIGIIGRSSLVIASIPCARFIASQPTTSPGLAVSFDGTMSKDYEPTGTIASWSWDFGDNTTGSGSTAIHTYTTPGTYTVQLTVADGQGYTDEFIGVVKVSDPPVAQPVTATTDEDTSATITLRATDPNLDPLTYIIVSAPAHGTLSLAGAEVLYTPEQDYYGSDGFTYRASDGRVDSNTANVSITINPVNDAPVAVNDVLPMVPGSTVTTVAPLVNDHDVEGDAFAITGFTQPQRGSVALSGDQFIYTPGELFQGFDSFTYTITDSYGASSVGEVSIASGVAVLDGGWYTFGNTAARTGYFAGFIGAV